MLFRRFRNAHTFDCFGRSGTDHFRHSIHKVTCDTSYKSRHSSFLARNENENPSSETSRPLTTSSLAPSKTNSNKFYPEIHQKQILTNSTLKFMRSTYGKSIDETFTDLLKLTLLSPSQGGYMFP